MQKAHLNFIQFTLANGHGITVYNGGDEAECERSTSYAEIKEHAEAADEAALCVFAKDGTYLGQALLALEYDQAPDEIIYDYSDSDFLNAWNAAYNKAA